jgi:magnesium transporter
VVTITAPTCPTSTRLYQGGKVIEEGFGADQAPAMLDRHPGAVLWLDLFDPDMADMQAIQEEFHLHPLAVEDAVDEHQRPKLDRYPEHLFMNVYAVKVVTGSPAPALHKIEISAFITHRALITVHKSAGDVDLFKERWDADDGLAATGGVGFLVYGMLDVVVDGQFAAARLLDEAIDEPEDQMLAEGGAPRGVRKYGFALRRVLANLRRAVAPMPDVIGTVLRSDTKFIDEHLVPYYRDVDDHARRANDTIEHAADRINSLLEADLNEQSNSLNDITRKLAAWAAIIAVPTAVTGYFGQNLPYPGYERYWGFAVSTLIIVATAGGLYWYLKHRDWL